MLSVGTYMLLWGITAYWGAHDVRTDTVEAILVNMPGKAVELKADPRRAEKNRDRKIPHDRWWYVGTPIALCPFVLINDAAVEGPNHGWGWNVTYMWFPGAQWEISGRERWNRKRG